MYISLENLESYHKQYVEYEQHIFHKNAAAIHC